MRRKIPSLQALACFDAAARHESYTRAAQELALTQSAVSRQIGALEDFLGLPLFRRTRHGVVLTQGGSQYARQIAPRLQALERDTLDAMAGQGAGAAVMLAAVPTFAARWLIPRLPEFSRAHPEVTVHIETRTRPFMFADSGFDAAIYASTPTEIRHWAGTRAIALMPEVVIPVCSPMLLEGQGMMQTQALAKATLLQQTTRPDAWRQWFDAAGLANAADVLSAFAGPRFEQFSMTAAAAAAGMGIALVPRLLIEDELARATLVQAHPLAMPEARYYYLVLPDTEDTAPQIRYFAAWLQAATTKG